MLSHIAFNSACCKAIRQSGPLQPIKAICWCLQLGCLPRAALAGTQAAAQADLKEIQLQLMIRQWWDLLATQMLSAAVA